jgi:hypothetical protein
LRGDSSDSAFLPVQGAKPVNMRAIGDIKRLRAEGGTMPGTFGRAGFALLAVTLATATAAQDVRYHGLCDASAAIALGPDHFIVAEDEADILAVYRRGTPDPVGIVDLVDYLGNRKRSGKVKEADIEAAARIGDRIYWITSHGRDKGGDVEETRLRLFATDIVAGAAAPTVQAVGSPPYKRLLEHLLGEAKFRPLGLEDAAANPPEAANGLNIEGLADTPEGHLLIGFRNPRPGGKALLIPLTNPDDVVIGGKRPAFGDAVLLDLGARGIRSIERLGDRYLIIAGPFGKGGDGEPGAEFGLYHWTGRPDVAPVRLEVELGALMPESVFAIPGANEIAILSDDGDEPVGGLDCKDKAVPAGKKGFRALTLKLG